MSVNSLGADQPSLSPDGEVVAKIPIYGENTSGFTRTQQFAGLLALEAFSLLFNWIMWLMTEKVSITLLVLVPIIAVGWFFGVIRGSKSIVVTDRFVIVIRRGHEAVRQAISDLAEIRWGQSGKHTLVFRDGSKIKIPAIGPAGEAAAEFLARRQQGSN